MVQVKDVVHMKLHHANIIPMVLGRHVMVKVVKHQNVKNNVNQVITFHTIKINILVKHHIQFHVMLITFGKIFSKMVLSKVHSPSMKIY